jgi:hypothetical protein
MAESRTVEARKADVLASLEGQHSMWLATADSMGRPHLIAVSAWWDGSDLVMTTVAASRTAKNLTPGQEVRLAGGTPVDAIVVDARVIETQVAEAAPDVADGFKEAMGWDPREVGPGWAFFRLRPSRIQAYRGYEELEGRDVMRNSRWLA